MDDLKTINITIAGRTFPVKLTATEEPVAVTLETELNERISVFQKLYPMRDKLDYVIMTMLSYTFDLKKSSTIDQKVLDENIDKIKNLLEETE